MGERLRDLDIVLQRTNDYRRSTPLSLSHTHIQIHIQIHMHTLPVFLSRARALSLVHQRLPPQYTPASLSLTHTHIHTLPVLLSLSLALSLVGASTTIAAVQPLPPF